MYTYLDELLRLRDLIAGQQVIKAKSTQYLPKNGVEELYPGYLARALLFEVVPATVDSYIGLVYRVDPVVTLPPALDFIRLDAGSSTLYTTVKRVLRDTIVSGVTAVLVDIDDAGAPYLTMYRREDIIAANYTAINGRRVLTYCKLREVNERFDETNGSVTTSTRDRVLRIVDGVYTVSITDDMGRVISTVTPTAVGGDTLSFIPLAFACAHGGNEFSSDIRPPLAALSNANIAHYQTTADLRQSLYFSGNPQLVLQGFGPTADGTRKMGPGYTLETPEATAKAYYLSPLPVEPLTAELKRLEELMSRLGADVFVSDAMALTATEASIRNTSKNSKLTNIVVGVSDAITDVLLFVGAILKVDYSDIRYELNTRFFSVSDSTYITSLLGLYTAGTISLESFLTALQEREVIQDADAEMAKLPKPEPVAVPVVEPTVGDVSNDKEQQI